MQHIDLKKLAIKQWLEDRKKQGLYRQVKISESPQAPRMVVDGKEVLSFCSNNYLGLANHPRVKKAFQKAADKYGVGSGAAHLINGHLLPHHELEERLSDITGRERTLLFSSGYSANLSVIDTFSNKNSFVFQDRLNHASLLDGVRLSGAKLKRYQHNDLQHLERLLEKYSLSNSSEVDGIPLIATDTVFSMDGDHADMTALSALAKKYATLLYVDDAHGFGIREKESGVVEKSFFNVNDVPIYMATLGKAIGVSGAFVSGDREFIEYLIQNSRPWIYTTAMPAALAAATVESLNVIEEEYWRKEKLNELIAFFKLNMEGTNLTLMPSNTAIQPIFVGCEEQALKLSEKLLDEGILITAIRYPTVPKNQARLRITLTSDHDLDDIDKLVNILHQL